MTNENSDEKIAVILFNLGGPDQLSAVRPFLINLFSDPNIIAAPRLVRWLLARFIAWRRTAVAQKIYAELGGGSPILAETRNQVAALQSELQLRGMAKLQCFCVMRYWHPRARNVASEVEIFAPKKIVLLPLYPQFSTTTTRSSLQEWRRVARSKGLLADSREICCYPEQPEFVAAHVALIEEQAPQYFGPGRNKKARLLFSAHGLPQRIVDKGDPYPDQVEKTAKAIAAKLGLGRDEWEICYQSRVGPLKWLGPSTEERLQIAGRDKMPVVLVPIAFVSEHSETLVELDMEYRHLADAAGVPSYIRIAALGVQPQFIQGLATLVQNALQHRILCGNGDAKCLMSK